jgi:hypothetical protein
MNRYAKHYGENTRVIYFNKEKRQILVFKKTSGDLITAEKFRKNYFPKAVESGQIVIP